MLVFLFLYLFDAKIFYQDFYRQPIFFTSLVLSFYYGLALYFYLSNINPPVKQLSPFHVNVKRSYQKIGEIGECILNLLNDSKYKHCTSYLLFGCYKHNLEKTAKTLNVCLSIF